MPPNENNMQISKIQDTSISPPCKSMDGMTKPRAPLSASARTLPGCRPCGLRWNQCEVNLVDSDNRQGVILHFRLAEIEWKRELKSDHGQIQCNLQELEVLRWMAEGETTTTSNCPEGDRIQYVPQRRYCCLFPHQPALAHDVMEIVSGMTAAELKKVGEEAIRDSLVLLCPAPAPLCTDLSHTSVTEEVHKIATYWPARQIICSSAVEGMIDIGPVSICRNDDTHNKCSVIETGRKRNAMPPTEIRQNMGLSRLHRSVERIIRKGRNNAQLALHSSWHEDILFATQDAVQQCQHRKANAQPTRLYDAHEGKIKERIQVQNYLALSYCWGEWPEESNDALEARLKMLSKRLAVRYFWVDRWCINQQDEVEKACEIANMRDYYIGASGCVVLVGPEAEPFQCLPQHNGAILSAYQQILLNSDGLQSLIRCRWATRLWTLQEALLSRQVVYSVQNQLVDGDFVSELVAYFETFGEQYSIDDEASRADPEWIGGYGCYRWNARAATIVYPRQFRVRESSKKSRQFAILRTVAGGEIQHKELQLAGGLSIAFEEALTMITDRYATKGEDYVYGLLGICEGGDKIKIEYDITWQAMLEKLQKAGMITERQLASSTSNELSRMSWLPRCGSDYGPFKNIEKLAAFVRRPKLSWSEERVIVLGAVFEWENFECPEWGSINIHGMSCRLVRGTIRFPDAPGIVAKVGGTTSAKIGFKGDRMNGTHVMLCRDVDENTPDTVAIKVSGNIESGHVKREDGYVLELHRWVKGDPRLIKGRQWTII